MPTLQKLTAAPPAANPADWVGGHLSVDFVNLAPRWKSYADILDWSQQADLIGPNSRRYLSAGSERAQASALKGAQALHASLHTLLQAAARHEVLPQVALDHLNSLVQKTAAWRHISAQDGDGRKVSCGWNFKGAPPAAVLGPIVWRSMELLESGPLDRIKECPPPQGCGWLFLDISKNRSRQWCSMKTCGNAAKVRRFRKRNKD